MAVDVCCSEIPCSGFSPRISFSYDLNQTDGGGGGGDDDRVNVRLDSTLLDSSSEFDFCVGSVNSAQELSPADELFSNGKILPIQIKKDEPFSQEPFQIQRSASLSSSYNNQKAPEKKRLKELLLMSPDSDLEEGPSSTSSSRSFLQFKRSLSLNFDRTRRKGLIRSLRFLSRSNSTGSAPNPKPNLHQKETQTRYKQQNQPKKPSALRRSTSLSTTGIHSSYHHHSSSSTHKPQPRKSFGAYNGNGGVRINPVLNFPPPSFMSNVTIGFFGFGSFLCYGKLKRKTR